MASTIKGGGRVELKPELEDAIVDYLRSHRQTKNPLLSNPDVADLSNESAHAAKNHRRKFLKKLVAYHERHQLSMRLNNVSLIDEDGAKEKKSNKVVATESKAKNSKKSGSGGGKPKTKVRLDIIEAVYKNNRDGGSKSKQGQKWKPGSTKKTLVFDTQITIEHLIQQAQSKLNMKKKAVRCFYVEKKIEIELTRNLEGLKDGSLVYLTSTKLNTDDNTKDTTCNGGNESEDDGDDKMVMDELSAVKQVYASRALRWNEKVLEAPITFSDFLDTLPEIPHSRQQLPAARCRTEILKAVDQSRVVIISGATGSGKSTQVPQFLLEGMLAASKEHETNIVVTQPRRVAALALAERVAQERDSPSPGKNGSTVGYHVRLDRSTTSSTRITYCTVGILLRKLTAPRVEDTAPLSYISHLIIDEVHERDLDTDFCLTILRRVLAMNPNIKIILMSATSAPELFINYFSSLKLGIEPVVVNISGRTFPVTTLFLEEIETMLASKHNQWRSNDIPSKQEKDNTNMSLRATSAIDNDFIKKLILYHVQDTSKSGAILVFLPGKGEIESLHHRLRDDTVLGNKCEFHPLHSTVQKKAQRQAFDLPSPGKTKVVLATNIAETSITISDVTAVIDTGRVKESRYNSSSRIKQLMTVWTSQASATQRGGRAGRVKAGTCYRLYSKEFFENCLLQETTPEILRTPLDELVLQACLLDEDRNDAIRRKQPTVQLKSCTAPVRFLGQTPDPPPSQSLMNACEHLIEIGALKVILEEQDREHLHVQLTPLGYHLSQLPMDAKIGKILIVGSILGCVEPSLTIAAVLSTSRPIFWHTNREIQNTLIEHGFGGAAYPGGTVKGDTIASVAAYDAWSNTTNEYKFAKEYGLDNVVLREIRSTRHQYRDCMIDTGFIGVEKYSKTRDPPQTAAIPNAKLASCCLVAGLYPNIATLVRPVTGKGGFKGGRLLTKNGDCCIPNTQSFQANRVRNVSQKGRDVYAVYHSKHSILGAVNDADSRAPTKKQHIRLTDVNFISRYTLLLFGGDLTVRDNFILIDEWLKFKIGEKGRSTAIMFIELRREMDNIVLERLRANGSNSNASGNRLISLISALLQEE